MKLGLQETLRAFTRRGLTARYGLLLILVIIMAFFSVLKPDIYLTRLNIVTIATNQAIVLVLALSILVPLIVGEFDLSMASNFGLMQLTVVGLIVRSHWSWESAIVATLVLGCVIGAVNAVLIVGFRINSFIATLGMATVLGGIATWYSNGQVIAGRLPHFFDRIGQASVWTVPMNVIYAGILAVLMWLFLRFFVAGRKLYATGGSRPAATLSGIRTGWLIAGGFVVCGGIAALAGVITASQLGAGQPSLGPSYLLPAYAGAFLGATTVTPGQFNVWGTVIATYLLGAGVTGLQQLGIQSWVQDLFNGAALIIAVGVSGYATRLRQRRGQVASRSAHHRGDRISELSGDAGTAGTGAS